jgi:hypothetical protein
MADAASASPAPAWVEPLEKFIDSWASQGTFVQVSVIVLLGVVALLGVVSIRMYLNHKKEIAEIEAQKERDEINKPLLTGIPIEAFNAIVEESSRQLEESTRQAQHISSIVRDLADVVELLRDDTRALSRIIKDCANCRLGGRGTAMEIIPPRRDRDG